MQEEFLAHRISELRSEKGVSARDMSLSLGLDPSYINNIENMRAFPSMKLFFAICDYFGITAQQFFDSGLKNPEKIQEVIEILKRNDEDTTDTILNLARKLDKRQV